ncbi:hypothetical protein QBC45DRAFT_400054 [Copromyces sp. CBS 386.78]|nr:hypothetical protein QBC45DRAFT_400054 [Copromyces sp. CBS 386.78]
MLVEGVGEGDDCRVFFFSFLWLEVISIGFWFILTMYLDFGFSPLLEVGLMFNSLSSSSLFAHFPCNVSLSGYGLFCS